MHRRQYLAMLGTITLAGCTSSDGSESTPTQTVTPTVTPSPTPSPTPAPQPPEVVDAQLVSEWTSAGDFQDNAIEYASVTDVVTIAFRWYQHVHDGTLSVFEQVEIYDGQQRVDAQTIEDEQIYDIEGRTDWEHAISFDPRDWNGPGMYEARIRVRDNVINEVSNTLEYEFELKT